MTTGIFLIKWKKSHTVRDRGSYLVINDRGNSWKYHIKRIPNEAFNDIPLYARPINSVKNRNFNNSRWERFDSKELPYNSGERQGVILHPDGTKIIKESTLLNCGLSANLLELLLPKFGRESWTPQQMVSGSIRTGTNYNYTRTHIM